RLLPIIGYFQHHHILITFMKTRTALPLLYALSFLMVFAGGVSACPVIFNVLLDSTSLTYNCGQSQLLPVTVRGSVTFPTEENFDLDISLKISITSSTQWGTITKINGSIVKDGDIIKLNR